MAPFDPREESASLVESYIIKNGEPEFDGAFLGRMMAILLTRTHKQKKRNRGEVIEFSDEEASHTELLMYMISALPKMTPEIKVKYDVWRVLQTIIKLDNCYPQKYQEIAKALFDEFEAAKWGKPAEPERYATSKRGGGPSNTAGPSVIVVLNAPDNHPIFGLNGPMHHVQRSQVTSGGTKRISYVFDPSFVRKTFKVFGHNGLTVGECWALLVAACRDGAHGARVAGIAGDGTNGCYSIVVAGHYDDKDKDAGENLLYSDSKAHQSTSPTADRDNQYVRALIRSCATKLPVRVLRSHDGEWRHRPRAGYRYDGLYEVDRYEEAKNKQNGAFIQFHLRRINGQPPIDTMKPTMAQQQLFKRVQDGY